MSGGQYVRERPKDNVMKSYLPTTKREVCRGGQCVRERPKDNVRAGDT